MFWLVVWNILFFHILGIIIPTDFHIFERGWNHQPVSYRTHVCYFDNNSNIQQWQWLSHQLLKHRCCLDVNPICGAKTILTQQMFIWKKTCALLRSTGRMLHKTLTKIYSSSLECVWDKLYMPPTAALLGLFENAPPSIFIFPMKLVVCWGISDTPGVAYHILYLVVHPS